MINEEFSCKRCAECCKKLTVKITKKDIDRIKKLGFSHFFEFDDFIRSYVLLKDEKGCIFLEEDQCKIYDDRPKTCKDYPFCESDEVEDCRPRFFSDEVNKG
jgi:Fe-S-cluster containining protein